jgi:uncharacterized protein YcfJ
MKKTNLIAAAVGFGLLMVSQASLAGKYYDTARVLKVKPIFQTVQVNHPREQCWSEPVYHRSGRTSAVPMISGAILGGAIGNQFGKGSGRKALTVAGMLLGGAIGSDIAHANSYDRGYSTMERRCRVVDSYSSRQEVVGYRVKYRHNGVNHWTRTQEHPGRYINVKVKVRPDRYNGNGTYYGNNPGYSRYDSPVYGHSGRHAGLEMF